MPEPRFMRRAIDLSLEGMRSGSGGPFGAVVVLGGEILGEGFNQVLVDHDPTAHAEVVAIRAACRKASSHELIGCELYTSCEPCPMCLGAVYWSRIERVYYGNTREDAHHIGFDDRRIYDELARPLGKREIEFGRLLAVEASVAFEEWRAMEDKTRY